MDQKNDYWMSISFAIFGIVWIILFFTSLSYTGIIPKNNSVFLVVATIIGTFLAIFISVITLAIQDASNKNLIHIISQTRKDSRLYLVIFISLFAILFNISAYLIGGLYFPALAVLFSGLSFTFVFLYFLFVLKTIDPFERLTEQSQKSIKELKRNIIQLYLKTKKEGAPEIPSQLLFYARFSQNEDFIKSNKKIVDELIDQIERSIQIGDSKIFERSLDKLKDFFSVYLEHKAIDSSNDKIIEYIYERLKYISYPLFKTLDHFRLIKLIKIYELLGIECINKLKSIGPNGISYMSSFSMEYIRQIGERAFRVDDLDLMKECIHSIKNIGLISIEKNNSASLAENTIRQLGNIPGLESPFVFRSAIHSINELYIKLVKSKSLNYYAPLREVENVFTKSVNSLKSYLELDTITVIFFGELAKDSFRELIVSLVEKAKNPPKEIATNNYETASKNEIKRVLKTVSKMMATLSKFKYYNFDSEIRFLFGLVDFLSKENLVCFEENYLDEIKEALKIIEFGCANSQDNRGEWGNYLDQLSKGLKEVKNGNKLDENLDRIGKIIERKSSSN